LRASLRTRLAAGTRSSILCIPRLLWWRREVCVRNLRRSWVCEDGDNGTTKDVAWCISKVPSEATSRSSLSLSRRFRLAIKSCSKWSFAARFCAYINSSQ
jgi:hypothetical protein